jgi:asparagine synthase (glutamine-hydrolysing)
MIFHFDEPFGNPTALLIHDLTKETKKYATVALAGDGGDEIFGGYPRYEAAVLYEKLKYIPKSAFKILNPLFSLLPENTSGNHKLRRLKTFVNSLSKNPDEMYEDWVSYFSIKEINELYKATSFDRIVKENFKKIKNNSILLKSSITDLKTFLPCNLLHYGDIMSMANSFEVRFPLIDHRIIEFMTSIDIKYRIRNGEKKYLLKKLLKNKIPSTIINKPKLGLNPPIGLWLKKDLKNIIDTYLSKDVIIKRGIFDYTFVQKIIYEHNNNKRDRSLHIWALIVLEEWFRQNKY